MPTYHVRIVRQATDYAVIRKLDATNRRGALAEAKRDWHGGQHPDGVISVYDCDPRVTYDALPIAVLRGHSDRWVDPLASALGQRGGRKGGKVRSAAKSAAARANGAKGGRPRKQ